MSGPRLRKAFDDMGVTNSPGIDTTAIPANDDRVAWGYYACKRVADVVSGSNSRSDQGLPR